MPAPPGHKEGAPGEPGRSDTMHESSLALNILDIVLQQVPGACTGAVRRVDLCLGEYAGVEEHTLASCFEMVALGTPADGAALAVERVAATGRCDRCGEAAVRQGRLLGCPECPGSSVTLLTGRELYVKSIEVTKIPRRHEHAHAL